MILHAGLIACFTGGGWRSVLIEGPSGAGKSDLALRAIDQGFRLVADDRTSVFVSGGALFGRAPDALAGLIEVRAVGVLREPHLRCCRIDLIARCLCAAAQVERLPDAAWEPRLGVRLPRLDLWPFEHSAPAKLRRALRHLGVEQRTAYQSRLADEDLAGNRRTAPLRSLT